MQIIETKNQIDVYGTVDELLDYAQSRIRTKSRAFYEREIRADLQRDGTSLIDRHAAQGAVTRLHTKQQESS